MYCLNMLAIALELASDDPAYEDVATKFFEHFLYIAARHERSRRRGHQLWDETDGFFYDVLHLPDGAHQPLKVRSMVGLIPLFAVETLEPDDRRRACPASSGACSGSLTTAPTARPRRSC